MDVKQDVIYSSSQKAFWKLFILVLTLGISIIASLFDMKSCYITILVQSCNNIYDFAPFTNNIKYNVIIKRESIFVIFSSLAAAILSIIALLGAYAFTRYIWIKLLGIFCVSIPLAVVYYDYKMNIKKESEQRCDDE